MGKNNNTIIYDDNNRRDDDDEDGGYFNLKKTPLYHSTLFNQSSLLFSYLNFKYYR